MAECPSRFAIASWRAGDLPPDEAQRVEAHLNDCQSCRAVRDEIESNAAEYESRAEEHLARLLERLEAERPATEVVPLAPRRRSRVATVAIAVGGLAAAAVLALVLVPALLEPSDTDLQGDIRFKGQLAVELVAKRGARQFRVTEGAELVAGDAIRFVVSTGAPGWISVFSIDGAGRLSPFYPDSDPATDPEPLRLGASGRHELPGSIILDDSLGHEDIVVVFSTAQFDRGPVHRAAARAGSAAAAAAELGPDFALQIVRVTKRPP
jgi:hypothetical protein